MFSAPMLNHRHLLLLFWLELNSFWFIFIMSTSPKVLPCKCCCYDIRRARSHPDVCWILDGGHEVVSDHVRWGRRYCQVQMLGELSETEGTFWDCMLTSDFCFYVNHTLCRVVIRWQLLPQSVVVFLKHRLHVFGPSRNMMKLWVMQMLKVLCCQLFLYVHTSHGSLLQNIWMIL